MGFLGTLQLSDSLRAIQAFSLLIGCLPYSHSFPKQYYVLEVPQGLPSCRVVIGQHAWLSDPGEAGAVSPFLDCSDVVFQ